MKLCFSPADRGESTLRGKDEEPFLHVSVCMLLPAPSCCFMVPFAEWSSSAQLWVSCGLPLMGLFCVWMLSLFACQSKLKQWWSLLLSLALKHFWPKMSPVWLTWHKWKQWPPLTLCCIDFSVIHRKTHPVHYKSWRLGLTRCSRWKTSI